MTRCHGSAACGAGWVGDTVGFRKVALALTATASLIGGFEGVRQVAYLDPVGIPTACFGRTQGVQVGQSYSREECEEYLLEEVIHFQREVRRLVVVPMEPHHLAAFTSFAYNVGIQNFRTSTLLRKLNAGDYEGACNELPRWVYAKGIKLPGLVNRREVERRICLGLEPLRAVA